MQGPIPHGIGYLRNLRSLLLNDNLIDGTLPDTLGGMEYLHQLDVQGNLLSGTLPPALGDMPRLKTLYAQKNRLSGSLPSTVGKLADLSHLLLQQNALSGPLPSTLGLLRSALVINISQNNLTHPLPSEIGQLGQLTHLGLNSNTPGLSSAIPNSLGSLASVQVLALAGNAFNGIVPAFLTNGFHTGRNVSIGGNPFYCPLEPWSFSNYAGVYCLHCPGENPVGADGLVDYTMTCSGHGTCIDGLACQCEAEWSGFAADCSQLACPAEDSAVGSAASFCSGVGTCVNAVNTSITCSTTPPSANEVALLVGGTVGTDFVNFHINCAKNILTVAQCQCPGGTVPPRCEAFTADAGGNLLVSSAHAVQAPQWLVASVAFLTTLLMLHTHSPYMARCHLVATRGR